MKQRLLLLTFAAVGGFLWGARSQAGDARFDHTVRNDFFAGFSGDAAALSRALQATERILQANPDHAEALVWHGSGVYYLAGQAFPKGDPQKGMELFEKGVAEMDRAVSLAPNRVGVRIPRGAVLLTATRTQQGPHVAPLVAKALSDYERVYEIQKNTLAQIATHPKGELLMGLADGYARTGNTDKAREFYEMTVREVAGSVYERNAKEWLATGKLAPQKAGCLGCHSGN